LSLTKKVFLIGTVLSIILIALFAQFALAFKWHLRKETVNIWLPKEYQIINKKDNTFLTLSGIKIDSKVSIYLNFEEFKRHFEKANIALIEGGKLYYWTEKESVIYVTIYQLPYQDEGIIESHFLSDNKISLTIDQSFGCVLGGMGIFAACAIVPVCIVAYKERDC
jgi:hypothetical protein